MPTVLPLYSVLPFVAMLLAIALLPALATALVGVEPEQAGGGRGRWGLPVLVVYLARQPGALVHMAADYVSFIILLAGLYVIAGGVLPDAAIWRPPRS